MQSKRTQQNANMKIDRLFERGLSDTARAPLSPMTEAQIASAAAKSKAGAAIWLLSHAKEILIGAVAFFIGVGATLTATRLAADKPASPPDAEKVVATTQDTTTDNRLMIVETSVEETDSASIAVETKRAPSPLASTSVTKPASTLPITTSRSTQPMPNIQHSPSHTSNNEPVVIKKIIVRRDTVHLRETVIVKDTVYETEN